MRCTESWKRAEPQISTLLLWVIELLLAGLEQICNGGYEPGMGRTRAGSGKIRKNLSHAITDMTQTCKLKLLIRGCFPKMMTKRSSNFKSHFLSPLFLNFIWS